VAETPRRLHPEVKLAIPGLGKRLRFGWRQAKTLVTAPLSMSAMAERALLIGMRNPEDDCSLVTAPTLVVTGERSLDQVVRVDSTLKYTHAIRGARAAVLAGTGHVGYLTRPDLFVTVVRDFVSSLGTFKHDAA
jgi:pimeloyl-ACP methyl ester carboxylesterase